MPARKPPALPLAQRLDKLPASARVQDEAGKQQVLAVLRDWLGAQREDIRRRFESGGDEARLLDAQTRAMDALLTALYRFFDPRRPASVALVATGGYGRRELFPYSDIDLLFLYGPGDEARAAALAQAMLYVLWDLGLKVGQSHRSLDEAIALARQDMTIRTSLLDARLVAGRKAVYEKLRERYAAEVAAGSVPAFIEAKLAERKARHKRFGDSRYMLEPNVKEGKGALRDLHTLWWITRYAYPVDSLAELKDTLRLTDEEFENFDNARHFLWRVRIILHYLAARAEERLTFDRQLAVARAMGYGNEEPTHAIARFMRRYFAAVRLVGTFTRIVCALLEEEKKRVPRKPLAFLWYSPWALAPFRLVGERLTVRSDDAFEQQPILMIELFRVAQTSGLDIHPRAVQLVARSLPRIDDRLRADSRANSAFMDILLGSSGVETALRRMSETGVLGRFVRDFGRVVGQTQFNRYHVYTVDEHTLVAIGILGALERGELRAEAPLSTSVVHRVQMRRVLYLALFCHDIAKGRGGDHSELGERIAQRLALRFGFSAEEAGVCGWLVGNHLLLSHTAFKRDLDDPKAIEDFVAQCQSPERLKLLLALTVADIRAVAPGVWNEWKASQLRGLYRRAEEAMGSGVAAPRQQDWRFRSELSLALPGWEEGKLQSYLDQGSPAFWAALEPKRHAAIAKLLVKGVAGPVLAHTVHDRKRGVSEIVVAAPDQHGLFARIAGAMSLAGANIVGAKAFTLKNGLAVDILQVQDAAGETFERPERLSKLAVYLRQSLAGEIDPAALLRARRRDAGGLSLHGQVFIDNEASSICSVIEVSGPDYPGFLSRVTQAIAALGLTIATAHVSTYGAQAVDVFYVKDGFGMKVTHAAKLKQIREELLAAI